MLFKLETPFPREVVSVTYCIDVGMKTFLKIFDRECEEEERLYNWLQAVDGVEEVEYDAMFGHYIWLQIEGIKGKDLNLWTEVQRLINLFIME